MIRASTPRPRPHYQTRAGRQTSYAGATVPAIPGKASRRTSYFRPFAWRTQFYGDPVDVEVIGRKPSTPSNAGHVPTACFALRPPTPVAPIICVSICLQVNGSRIFISAHIFVYRLADYIFICLQVIIVI